ncbi:MAG: hypothetical protein KC535_01945 [Nanoarchaeota archaeon]|nr:hypothetical protein [Nanoarchaeota archaeon]
MIPNKKAASQAIWIITAVVIAAITIGLSSDLYAKGGKTISNQIDVYSCTASYDQEGKYELQMLDHKCPCDIDDENNPLYVGKVYTVKESIYKNQATKIFTKEYLDKFQDSEFTMYQVDVDSINEYITKNYESIETDLEGTVDYSYKVNNFLVDGAKTPSMETLCPSLGSKAAEGCQFQIFMEDWFEEGTTQPPRCATDEDLCYIKYQEKCGNVEPEK